MALAGSSLLSVEQVAGVLGVHVRTVRRYLREGRLKGTRIGKQYRIAAGDLAALTGQPAAVAPHIEASTVVQIDAIHPDAAARVVSGIGGAIQGRDKQSDTPLRVDTVYDAARARLKIIVTGSLATNIGLLKLIDTCAQPP
jgi:excisionase family DNA binding protein